jgi:hypothetical protein
MKRIFWVALGATAGILVARQIAKSARSLTPDGAADRVAGAVGGLTQAFREFADDVKAGMAERDIELREALGIADNGTAADVDRMQQIFDQDYSRGT